MANTVVSSTLHFEGPLAEAGNAYSGVIPMIDEGGAESGYDLYAEDGDTAWFGDDPGSGPVWTSQAIGAEHDAWPTYTPDTPDWYQYSLELYEDGGVQRWALRNHPGATAAIPWSVGGDPPAGVPMSGIMDWTAMYAAETDLGAYLPGTGIPEIPGGAAGQGGGPAAWDMDWSWGSEMVPLQFVGFAVTVTPTATPGEYQVVMTPAAPDEVWVDDDFTAATPGWGATHFASIQDGIDAVSGSTVHVAAGTYVEELYIDKDVEILGAGRAVTTIASPATISNTFGSTHPIVLVEGTDDVTIQDVTIDGQGLGNANFKFAGVAYYNAGGALLHCDVLRIRDTPLSGTQHGVAIYGYVDSATPYSLEIGDCVIDEFQKNAFALVGDGLTVDVHDCTVTGAGHTNVTAQNGIQISDGAGGTITDCSVEGIWWTGETWTASGILLYDGTSVDLTGVTLTDAQTAFYSIDTDGSLADLDISGVGFDAISLVNTDTSLDEAGGRVPPSPIDTAGARGEGSLRAAMSVVLVGGCLDPDGNPDTWGIGGYSDGGALDISVANFAINGFDKGVVPYDAPVTLTVVDCDLSGNTTAAYDNSFGGSPQLAENVWWGDASGPSGDGGGSGGAVLPTPGSNVDFDPWRIDGTSATTCAFTPLLQDNAVTPTADDTCIDLADGCATVDFGVLRATSDPVRGFSVTFQLSANLKLEACPPETQAVREGTYLSDVNPLTAFQLIENGGKSYTVDCAILGTPCGATAPTGSLFEIDVARDGADGPGSITITSILMRDCANQPVAIVSGPPALITVDTSPPAALADLAAEQWRTGNDSDGTTKIDLTWTAPGEADAATIDIYRQGYGDYPEYDDVAGAVPLSPLSTHVATLPATATSYTDEPETRDFWYYEIYVTDACGNESDASNMTDGTLNYHLGDVSDGVTPGQGDNLVNGVDISLFGAHYGMVLAPADPFNYLDVGPTSDNSVHGLPTTDNLVQFEDLIMFAINYNEVSFTGVPAGLADLPSGEPRLELLLEPVDADHVRARLLLAGNPGTVKGIHAVIEHPGATVVAVDQGALLEAQAQPVFFTHLPESDTGIHAAILGRDVAIHGQGEIASLLLRMDGGTVTLARADLRDLENRFLGDPPATTGIGDAVGSPLPTRYELLGAVPNPFNPSTTISFRLPEASPVSLKVYDVGGHLVRALVNGVLPAGEHGIRWDGRDGAGRQVGSGVYLYAIEAGDIDAVEKLVLLK